MNEFNSNFFIVAATVIPVLYLALTLQGPMYERVMTRWRSAVKEGHLDRNWKSETRTIAAAIFAMFVAGVILFSIYAEYMSIEALYSEHATRETQRAVIQAFIALLALTAVGPLYAFGAAYFGTLSDDYRAAKARRVKRIAAEKSRDERAIRWMERREKERLIRQAEQEREKSGSEEAGTTETTDD